MITEAVMTYDEMVSTARTHVCGDCGKRLNVAWINGAWALRCDDLSHSTVTKHYKSEDQKFVENDVRRFELEQKNSTAVALRKYEGSVSLTTVQAREIIITLWPDAEQASPTEVFKAMTICAQYGLNPLMNHIFLIPFKDRDSQKNIYATVMGIGAKRLIASRKHSFSYIDDTPRIMSRQEQEKIFGAVDESKIRFITKLKDTQTGATAQGYGEWAKEKFYQGKGSPNQPKGTDRGNSMENMAAIRSESQALARLYPADMPGADIPVLDATFEKPVTSNGVVEGEVVEEHEAIAPSADETFANMDRQDEKQEAEKPTEPAKKSEPAAEPLFTETILPNGINLDYLKGSLNTLQWSRADVGDYLHKTFSIKLNKDVLVMVGQLTRPQAEAFVKEVGKRLAEVKKA